jgi:hypothetical protein
MDAFLRLRDEHAALAAAFNSRTPVRPTGSASLWVPVMESPRRETYVGVATS